MDKHGRLFDTAVIISAATGRFVCGDFGKVYEIYDFMTGDNLFTHQLLRAGKECTPYLKELYPWLANCDFSAFDQFNDAWSKEDRSAVIQEWLKPYYEKYGASLPVYPIAHEDHIVKDPIAELHEIAPNKPIIIVNPPPSLPKP